MPRRYTLAGLAGGPSYRATIMQVALAGLMLRSLQMATRLRHAFDPSAGYAAGATLVKHAHTVTTLRPTQAMATLRPRHAVARARSKAARPSEHFPCNPALHPCSAGCHRPRGRGRGALAPCEAALWLSCLLAGPELLG